jgi:hypothetical protein
MRSTTLRMTCSAITFAAGVILASLTAMGTILDCSKCNPAFKCNTLPDMVNTSCPKVGANYTKCSFANAGETIAKCDIADITCHQLDPNQPQPCNGACVQDQTISCSMSYNKCQ